MPQEFSDVLERWVATLDSVDIRVATRRVRDKGRETEHWRLTAAVVRISSRSIESIRRRHIDLGERFGPSPSRNFAIKLVALPVSAVPRLPERQIVQPLIADTGDVALGLFTGRGLSSDLGRWRRYAEPWDAESSAAYEFLYQLPENTQYIDDVFAAERGAPIQETERLAAAYLELRPSGTAPRGGNVVVVLESPARIASVSVSGTSVKIAVSVPQGSPRVQVVADRLDGQTGALLQRLRMSLEPTQSGERSLEGEATFLVLHDRDAINCSLEDTDLGELDVFREDVANLRQPAERNPLLSCLGKFWELPTALDVPLLRPDEVVPTRETRTPQRAFQAAVAHLLALAGIPTIDLKDRDKLYSPGGRVELGTADVLGFHMPARLFIVGACTMNVPRPHDADALLNVTALLREVVPSTSGVRFVPILFSNQRGEPATRTILEEHGVRLLVHDDLQRLRALVERGNQGAALSYLTGTL